MNAPSNEASQIDAREGATRSTEAEPEINEDGWFVDGGPSATRPTARPKSSPPTGDDEVDRWLR
jgi:hypothetical protein